MASEPAQNSLGLIARVIIRLLQQAWSIWLWRIVPALAALLPSRSPTQAVLSWPEAPAELGPRVALFMHFDRYGNVRPYVLHYLARLREAGLSVLFVSNCRRLQPGALEALKPLCAGILLRRNVGYDFAALREGLAHFGLPRANTEMLVMANDSVYGPLVRLRPILDRIDFDEADLWGATESWQLRYHLQSYFLVVGPKALRHPAWAAFWRRVRSEPSKHLVISRYEVGLSQAMLRAGLRCAAIWPYTALVQSVDLGAPAGDDRVRAMQADLASTMRRTQSLRIRNAYVRRVALNPTSDLWRHLLLAGYPFIKRGLLRDNPGRVADLIDWRAAVAQASQADVAMIERDLQSLVRNTAP